MDPDLVERRRVLVERHDSLAPEGGRPGTHSAELCEVADALGSIAAEAENRGDRGVEVARTWRWAGMAYHDAAGNLDAAIAARAVAAYERAEHLIDRTVDAVDAIKNDYCMARALMNLSDGPDPSAAQRAVDRLIGARAAARREAPELVPAIEAALVPAEQVAALRGHAEGLDEQARRLSARLADTTEPGVADMTADELAQLFDMLQQTFAAEAEQMDPQRRQTLTDVMESLARLVAAAGTERPLGDMANERRALAQLMEQMKAPMRRPGGT